MMIPVPSSPTSPSDRGSIPPELAASASLQLIALGRQAQAAFDASLEDIGLSMRFLGVLGHLSRNPAISVSDLARRAHVTSQSMHVTVQSMEADGLVTTLKAGPGRRSQISVTARGSRLMGRAMGAARDIDDDVLVNLDTEQRQALHELLRVIDPPPPRKR